MGGVTVDDMQIDPGTIATKTTDVDEIQIDSGVLSPLATISTGLQVNSLKFLFFSVV